MRAARVLLLSVVGVCTGTGMCVLRKVSVTPTAMEQPFEWDDLNVAFF